MLYVGFFSQCNIVIYCTTFIDDDVLYCTDTAIYIVIAARSVVYNLGHNSLTQKYLNCGSLTKLYDT